MWPNGWQPLMGPCWVPAMELGSRPGRSRRRTALLLLLGAAEGLDQGAAPPPVPTPLVRTRDIEERGTGKWHLAVHWRVTLCTSHAAPGASLRSVQTGGKESMALKPKKKVGLLCLASDLTFWGLKMHLRLMTQAIHENILSVNNQALQKTKSHPGPLGSSPRGLINPCVALQEEASGGRGNDQVRNLQSEVEGVKNIMTQNVERILARGENLDHLRNKTEDLEATVSWGASLPGWEVLWGGECFGRRGIERRDGGLPFLLSS